jgi:hypothetical protein
MFSTTNAEWAERFKDRIPHVFIGIVAFQDIANEIYTDHIQWFMQMAARLSGQFHVSIGVTRKMEQYRARNELVLNATKQGADFLIMLDDDQTLMSCPDMIEKFWELGAPVAGGLYWQRKGLFHPVVLSEYGRPGETEGYRFYHPSELPTVPTAVDVLGGGCNWFDMAVFDKLKEPHWWPYPTEAVLLPDEVYGLDIQLCRKLRDQGHECILHPDIKIGHLSQERQVISEEARPPQAWLEDQPWYQEYWVSVQSDTVSEHYRVR